MEVNGKVLEHGTKESEPGAARPYRFAWVRVLDSRLREIIEVLENYGEGEIDPYAVLNVGDQFSCRIFGLRLYKGTLTGNRELGAVPAASES